MGFHDVNFHYKVFLPQKSFQFFSWGYLESKVYVNKTNSNTELKNEIWRVVGQIDKIIYNDVIENFAIEIKSCNFIMGGLLTDIIFHSHLYNVYYIIWEYASFKSEKGFFSFIKS